MPKELNLESIDLAKMLEQWNNSHISTLKEKFINFATFQKGYEWNLDLRAFKIIFKNLNDYPIVFKIKFYIIISKIFLKRCLLIQFMNFFTRMEKTI